VTHAAILGTAEYSSTGVASLALTVGAAVPVGYTVCMGVVWDGGGIPTINSIADSRSNTWATDVTAGTGNSTVACAVMRARVTTALVVNDTITVTLSANKLRWLMQADSFDDLNASSTLDLTATNHNPGSVTSLSSGTTGTIAQAYELDYAVFGFGRGSSQNINTVAAGWDYTGQLNTVSGTTPRGALMLYRYTSATGTQQATGTLTAAATNVGCIATYRATQRPKGWGVLRAA
jgi:hypothetical protein